MRVMGVDPGTRCVGYGLIDAMRGHCVAVDFGVVKAVDQDGSGSSDMTASGTLLGHRIWPKSSLVSITTALRWLRFIALAIFSAPRRYMA